MALKTEIIPPTETTGQSEKCKTTHYKGSLLVNHESSLGKLKVPTGPTSVQMTKRKRGFHVSWSSPVSKSAVGLLHSKLMCWIHCLPGISPVNFWCKHAIFSPVDFFACRRIAKDFESASPDGKTGATPEPGIRLTDTPEPGARLSLIEATDHPYRSVDGAVTEQFATLYKEPLQADRWAFQLKGLD